MYHNHPFQSNKSISPDSMAQTLPLMEASWEREDVAGLATSPCATKLDLDSFKQFSSTSRGTQEGPRRSDLAIPCAPHGPHSPVRVARGETSERSTPGSYVPRNINLASDYYTMTDRASMAEKLNIGSRVGVHVGYQGHIPEKRIRVQECATGVESRGRDARVEGICGYTGHVHALDTTMGQTFGDATASARKVQRQRWAARAHTISDGGASEQHSSWVQRGGGGGGGRAEEAAAGAAHARLGYGEQERIRERYQQARRELQERGFEPMMVVQLARAKLQDRFNLFPKQRSHIRGLLQMKDKEGSGTVDEGNFVFCLDELGLRLTDTQQTVLMSFFDEDCTGRICYDPFVSAVCLETPRGGTAVIPKPIMMTGKAYANIEY